MRATMGMEWIAGFYDRLPEAESVMREGLRRGIPKNRFSLLPSSQAAKELIKEAKKKGRYNEYRWALGGAILGFLLGSVGGYFLFPDAVAGPLSLMVIFMRGLGVALMLGFIGFLFSSVENELSTEKGPPIPKDKVMLVIGADPQDQAAVRQAEELISESGVPPVELSSPPFSPRPSSEPS